MRETVTAEELAASGSAAAPAHRAAAEELAFIQYTSGSTGNPKGVALTHANLLANVRAMGDVVEATPDDVFVSWLPLYHDMGLIGAWFGTLVHSAMLVVMSPMTFLSRPSRWLRALHRFRGTLSAGPNFAFSLCLRRIDDDEREGLDLGRVRALFNGAEPVLPGTVRRFEERFAREGLRPGAVVPVYGLAESSVGLTFPPPGRGLRTELVDRAALFERGHAVPAERELGAALELVSCGPPLPGHEVRVVDATGRELPDRQQGELEFRGPSATRAYVGDAGATARLLHDGWLRTGDLAYIAGGEVYLTGRSKDLIIHAGRNIHPTEIEEAVGDVPGVRKGCVCAIGCPDPSTGTERLVVVAETHQTEPAACARIEAGINAAVASVIGAAPEDVVLAPPHAVPKTSSGKVRRSACREALARGTLLARRGRLRAAAELAYLALVPRVRRLVEASATMAYAVWTCGRGCAWPCSRCRGTPPCSARRTSAAAGAGCARTRGRSRG